MHHAVPALQLGLTYLSKECTFVRNWHLNLHCGFNQTQLSQMCLDEDLRAEAEALWVSL